MNKSLIWFTSRITLIIFTYIILYFGIIGLTSNYREGDSINYHIPIASAFLSGDILNPAHFDGEKYLKYSPGNSEAIISGLMLVKIPINVYNVIGLIALFAVCFYTARKFLMEKDYAIIFSGSIVTLHTMLRWINTQVIDIWLGVWFVLLLGILQKPEKSIKYFAFIGLAAGMLIGTKFSGPLFLLILGIFYIKKIFKFLNFESIIAFIIPFSLLGLSWYLRNYLVIGNPMYPQSLPMFENGGLKILSINVWRATFLYPNGIPNFINAMISEFGLWSLSIFTPLLLLSKKVRKSHYVNLILIGTALFAIFLFLPSDKHYNIAVSVFRYSYPAFITFILAIFLLAKKFKKESLLIIFALVNLLIIPELAYKPKLLFLLLPIALIIFYEEEVVKFLRNKVPLKAGK